MSALQTLTQNMAKRFELESSAAELMETLKATAFRGQVSDAQMTALMLVAQQYTLNPWTREIYAFPDKNNGIVPVVGVDGWSRIINSHPQFDGIEFEQTDEHCTCIIYRKDRSRPIKVTEWMSECRRSNVGPWQSHPKRMLRHKAMIQCARLAFGFTGIFDQDEAERIIEKDMGRAETIQQKPEPQRTVPELPECTAEKFTQMCRDVINGETGEIEKMGWKSLVQSGQKSAEHLIKVLSTKYKFNNEQLNIIESWESSNGND